MKKCRNCSKVAALHVTEIQHGEVQQLHLCESCAQDYLQANSEFPSDSEPDVLVDKLNQIAGDDELSELDQLACPNCGVTFREFRSKGRLGCPHDYSVFQEELLPLLDNIHNDTEHRGKFPKRAPGGSQQYQLIKLRNDLRIAVDEENYESAAQIRDEIQSLESTLETRLAED